MTQEFSQNHHHQQLPHFCCISVYLYLALCFLYKLLLLLFSVPYFPLSFILNPFMEHSLPPHFNCYPTFHQGPCLSFCIFLSSHAVGVGGGSISIFFPSHRLSQIIRLHLHLRKRKFILSLYLPALSFSSPFHLSHFSSFTHLPSGKSCPFNFTHSIHLLWFQYPYGWFKTLAFDKLGTPRQWNIILHWKVMSYWAMKRHRRILNAYY